MSQNTLRITASEGEELTIGKYRFSNAFKHNLKARL